MIRRSCFVWQLILSRMGQERWAEFVLHPSPDFETSQHNNDSIIAAPKHQAQEVLQFTIDSQEPQQHDLAVRAACRCDQLNEIH